VRELKILPFKLGLESQEAGWDKGKKRCNDSLRGFLKKI